MNIVEKKNVLFRIIAAVLLLASLSLMILSLITIANSDNTDKALAIVACAFAAVASFFETILILKGWKKESSLYKIAFNDNGVINNVSAIAVGVGTALGLALTIISVCLFFTKKAEPFTTSCLVIFSIGLYLLINCLIYFIYVIFFKKRQLRLEDFAK